MFEWLIGILSLATLVSLLYVFCRIRTTRKALSVVEVTTGFFADRNSDTKELTNIRADHISISSKELEKTFIVPGTLRDFAAGRYTDE